MSRGRVRYIAVNLYPDWAALGQCGRFRSGVAHIPQPIMPI